MPPTVREQERCAAAVNYKRGLDWLGRVTPYPRGAREGEKDEEVIDGPRGHGSDGSLLTGKRLTIAGFSLGTAQGPGHESKARSSLLPTGHEGWRTRKLEAVGH
jgi:hypothetical protein